MDADIAIKVEGLGKRYRIGERRAPYRTLRETIVEIGRMPFKGSGIARKRRDTFWALRDVNLEVRRGEVLGVIGRNGAGKSTLLKILSRITEPTTGRVEICGRLGSLLEVGTGFHPELTGRENIFLNGAILGMKRIEISRRFEEIVAFADVERFLDTPVKHYSSGMYVRLAFAVAAHLDSEILLIDEVLAVGDAAFQKKCLGRMGDVASGGKTIVFVSHNLAAVTALCHRVAYVEEGQVRGIGLGSSVVEEYLRAITEAAGPKTLDVRRRRGSGKIRLETCDVCGGSDVIVSGGELNIVLGFTAQEFGTTGSVHVAIGVRDHLGRPLFHLSTEAGGGEFEKLPRKGTFQCRVPELPLQPGIYLLSFFVRVGHEIADWIQYGFELAVESGNFFENGRLPPIDQGSFLVRHRWSLTSTGE